MKTSTLVILIAAALVVGGACIGISMSGMLNDNSPVVPDDPIVPPTDTPDEPDVPDEPEEPEVPLSYFATTTSSSSSKSDEAAECEHVWSDYTPDTNANTHSKVCSLCQAKDTQDCTFVEKDTDDGTIRTYSEECTCGRSNIFLKSDSSSKTVQIYTAEGLFKFAKMVNEEAKNHAGYTVTLENDIDLENKQWTPIGQTGETEFKGVFDGQNYEISNLFIKNTDLTEGQHGLICATGLFGWVESHGEEGVTIKNVKINTANVFGYHNVGVIVGYVYGTIENCYVSNAIIDCENPSGTNSAGNPFDDGDKCGGIAGYVGEDATIKGCTVSDTTISAGRDAGQVVGAARSDCVTDCSATDVTVTADGSSTGKNIRNEVIGRVLNYEGDGKDFVEDTTAKTISIYNSDGLVKFEKKVNCGINFAGYTVTLMDNIYLNEDWTPIGQTGHTQFAGTFDGNDKTIYNLNVDSTAEVGENHASGLFGWFECHTGPTGIKNLTIDGATIKGNQYVGALAGYISGYVVIKNCHVKNAEISAVDDGDKAGALVGLVNANDYVTDCSATNCQISAGRDAGQIIGCMTSNQDHVTGITVTNVIVTATGLGTGANIKNEIIGRTT